MVQEGAGRPSLFDPGAGALAENNLGDEYLCRTGAFNCESGKPDGFKSLFVPEPGIPSPPVPSGSAGSWWSRLVNWLGGARTFEDFATPALRASHFAKHGKEWGTALTEAQYLNRARALLRSRPGGDILGATRANGDILRYNKVTNEFAVGSESGAIRTLFKPKDGLAYWIQQLGGI